MKFALRILFLTILSIAFSQQVHAQLALETRKVFEEIVDELDEDLKKLFVEAIDKNTATIEFTPEQFRRFRSHPANPFEGLDSVDADSLEGNIALKFELPTVRNRNSDKLERQHPKNLEHYAPALKSWRHSIVQVKQGDKEIALGTVITREGFILTKASEVEGKKNLTCVFADSSKREAVVQGVDKKNDVAVLKVTAEDLSPVQFSSTVPKPGAFLVTGKSDGNPAAIGVCSTYPRSLLPSNPAYLGVRPIDSDKGVRVDSVTQHGAAENAGIRKGDILRKIDGEIIKNVTEMVNQIRQRSPNDKVVIEYVRDGLPKETTARLKGRGQTSSSTRPATTQFGAELSSRSTGFPLVIQHDTPLLPEQCGGPIVDLDGNVVGINIARHGRVGSYALPGSHVKKIVDRLLRRDVASRPDK